MSSGAKRDLAASVKQRLLALARERSEDFQYVLIRYAIERLLYRLSQSPQARQFILKGATLYSAWEGGAYRPTKDLDLLGRGSNSPEALTKAFQDIARIRVDPDGIEFDPDSVRAESIREEGAYSGVRVHLAAKMGKARIVLQVDIGFGDPVTPGAVALGLPTMLGFPAPRLQAYPPESMVAGKLETLARLGMKTSRMKDFCDLWHLAGHFSFEGALLKQAIRATFHARGTPMPSSAPVALTEEFDADASKARMWRGFLSRSGITTAWDLHEVMQLLRAFLLPVLLNGDAGFDARWKAGGPWQEESD